LDEGWSQKTRKRNVRYRVYGIIAVLGESVTPRGTAVDCVSDSWLSLWSRYIRSIGHPAREKLTPASEWFSSLQRNRVCGYTASVERTPAKVLVNDGTTFTQVDEGEQRTCIGSSSRDLSSSLSPLTSERA